MPSESDDRRSARLQHGVGGTLPPEPEHLPCPRCDSTDTKFCYYNNYNLAQPRYLCKSCRRYWTRGGTLRNVPVGGGTRKNHGKRSRTTEATPPPSSSPTNSNHDPIPADPSAMTPGSKTKMRSPPWADVNLNENVPENESFSSLLSSTGAGFFALGGFGSSTGCGFRDFGLGAGVWHGGVDGGGGESGSGVTAGCNAWQEGSVDGHGGLADDDFFNRPELAISTPGNRLLK